MKFYITMHRSHVSSKQSTAILSKLWNHKFREKEHYCLKKKNYCLQKIRSKWRYRNNATTLYLNNQLIPCVHKFKYLCINFIAKRTLTVDTVSVKRKFYVACNSVQRSEIIQAEFIKSYCLPILVHSLGALEMNASFIQELSVVGIMVLEKKIRLRRGNLWNNFSFVVY